MNKYRVVYNWYYRVAGDDFADSWGEGCEETIAANDLDNLAKKLMSDIVECNHEDDEIDFTCYDESGKEVLSASYDPGDEEVSVN